MIKQCWWIAYLPPSYFLQDTHQTDNDWTDPFEDAERGIRTTSAMSAMQRSPSRIGGMQHSGSQRSLRGFDDEFDDRDNWSRQVDTRRGMGRGSSHKSLRDFDDESLDDKSDGRSCILIKLHRGKERSSRLSRSYNRSSSRNSLRDYDDDTYDSDDDSRSAGRSKRSRKSKKSKKKKRSSSRSRLSDTSDSDSDRRTSKDKAKKSRKSRDKALRDARKLIEKHEKEQELDEEQAQTAASEMAFLIATLKKEREDMESKLKKIEDEATKLKLERIESQKSLMDLEHQAKVDRKAAALADLEAVKKEKEEMVKMILQLEQAKMSMEGRFHSNTGVGLGVAPIDSDDRRLGLGGVFGLPCLNTSSRFNGSLGTRTSGSSDIQSQMEDLQLRLIHAEGNSQQLKLDKRTKKVEIEQLKAISGGISTPLLEASERQKREISKKLKRFEEEKAQIRSQMAHLDHGRTMMEAPMLAPHDAQGQPYIDAFGVSYHGSTEGHQNNPLLGTTQRQVRRRSSIGHGISQPVAVGTVSRPANLVRSNSHNQLMNYNDPKVDIPGMDAGMGIMSGLTIDSNNNIHVADDITMASDIKESSSGTKNKNWNGESEKKATSDTASPAGWLGEQIRRNSCKDLMGLGDGDGPLDRSYRSTLSGRDPGGSDHRSSRQRNRSKGRDSSSRGNSRSRSTHHGRSGSNDGVESKRERARRSEKRLRDEMRRSRGSSSRSLRSVDAEEFY